MTEVLVQAGPVRALAALFDTGLPAPGPGDPLPPLWHWAALPTWPPAGETGPDGHPRHVTPPHPPGFPRRMFAGGTVRLLADLTVGSTVDRTVEVLSTTPKSGRQGDFVLSTVQTRLTRADGVLAVVETQDIVYRPASPPTSAAPVLPEASSVDALLSPADRPGEWVLRTDPVRLMRFSAATANGHRIHYDLAYAMGVEGYPGLVVHGPLMTLALLETVRLRDAALVTEVTHRNMRPLFCGQEARITGTDELSLSTVDGVHVTARVAGGSPSVSA
ncbi:hypothetical protein AB0J72_56780 [Dactylosporangium sp. NPDC049742]|uniref:hypothetical protein n=1 Tax=Dactylosporangium sp. NPDC049742 TaxID=3154737 RepID=UPI0034322ECF